MAEEDAESRQEADLDEHETNADRREVHQARDELGPAAHFIAWLLGIVAVTFIAGQLVALPLFVTLYLKVWGRCDWWFALCYGVAGWAFLYVMFDRVIAVMWHPSMLFF